MVVGQNVWFTPAVDCDEHDAAPLAAIVTHVFEDEELPDDMKGKEYANLAVFHVNGATFGEKCIPVLASGAERPDTEFCEEVVTHAKHKEHKAHYKTKRAAHKAKKSK